jgi:hypothetical protein
VVLFVKVAREVVMCGISAIRTDLRVSIQARGAPNSVRGHLAVGVLADSNLVIVPNPPRALLDDSFEFSVWIIPVPVQVDKAIEVIGPLKKNFMGVRENRGEPTVVLIELAHRSIYASQVGRCDGRELGRALAENGGNMWNALVAVGTVSRNIGEELASETLLAAAEAERAQRRARRSDMNFDSYQDLGVAFCWPWVCFCNTDNETDFAALASGEANEAST